MLTTLGPGIFDWEAAGGGQSSREETSVRLHGATSARPSLKPSRSNPCELCSPCCSTSPWDAGSWALAPQGHTPPLRQSPPLQAEEPRQPKADRGVYF